MPWFAVIAVALTLTAAALIVVPLLRDRERSAPIAAALVALAVPATILIVYLVVSSYRWNAPPAPPPQAPEEQTAATGEAGSMAEALVRLEARLAKSPDDEQGWLLLGSAYVSLGRSADAIGAYTRSLNLSGGKSMEAKLGIAEAQILQDRNALTGDAGVAIEAVLAEEPRNAKALWYGGLLALSRGDPGEARARWRTLLELAPPERVRRVLEAQLAQLGDAAPGATTTGTASVVPPVASAAAAGRGIAVRVSVGEAVRDRVTTAAPLFIFVRDAAGRGPPLAVIRRQASELPLTLRISDADVMIPGRSLGAISQATVVARIANGGDPIPKPGDVFGEAAWSAVSDGPLGIVIDRVVE